MLTVSQIRQNHLLVGQVVELLGVRGDAAKEPGFVFEEMANDVPVEPDYRGPVRSKEFVQQERAVSPELVFFLIGRGLD